MEELKSLFGEASLSYDEFEKKLTDVREPEEIVRAEGMVQVVDLNEKQSIAT